MNHLDDHIKAVFFDHDDTLVGTIKPKWAEHKYVAKTYYGKDLTDDELRKHWGKPLREILCLLYETDDADQAVAYTQMVHAQYPKELFTATIPTLQHLHGLGKKVGIVTSTARFSLEHDLSLHRVPQEIIDYMQTADDTAFHKPDPRVFTPAISWLVELEITPQEVLYIGDGLLDLQAAAGAGFNFLGVETGLITAEEFKSQGGKSIASLEELLLG